MISVEGLERAARCVRIIGGVIRAEPRVVGGVPPCVNSFQLLKCVHVHTSSISELGAGFKVSAVCAPV